jgi:hypothetical protein
MSHPIHKTNSSSSQIAMEEIYPLPIPLPPPPMTRKKKKASLPLQHTVKSIDEKHNEIMAQFCEIERNQLPEWKKRTQLLRKKIRHYLPEWNGDSLPSLCLDSVALEEKIYGWKEEMDKRKIP